MNLSQAVSGAQPKSWLDSRLTQLRRAPKSLPVQFHSFLSRAHHLIMHEPLSQRACSSVPFSLCFPLDFLISLKERAHGYPDADDAEGGYSGTLQRFAFALQSRRNPPTHFLLLTSYTPVVSHKQTGMFSPLLGIAGVNSLLFAAYGTSKRIISPFGQLSLKETAAAGAMAGAANAILASPVEMFKVRMQGQYGNPSDKRLRVVAREMWAKWGFRKGVMRGYWVRTPKLLLLLSRLTFFFNVVRSLL